MSMFLKNEEGLIGKYSSKEKTITYFHNKSDIEVNPLSNVTNKYKQIPLQEKEKVYWLDESSDIWKSGLFLFIDEVTNDLLVWESSETPITPLSLENIHIRSGRDNHVLSDFFDMTPERYKSVLSKIEFLKNYCGQARSSDGIATLLSTPVEIYEHQVKTVSTVLKDPIQRYLLADEVGLGKTIEAGLILKQHIYEEESSKILIITPKPIRLQWVDELKNKIGLDLEKLNISFVTFEEIKDFKFNKYSYVVIDESHRLIHLSESQFKKVKKVCLETEKLLLLSATPPIGNEKEYLKMMHLIDPENFNLEEEEAFIELVNFRNTVGGLLGNLNSAIDFEDLSNVVDSLTSNLSKPDLYLKNIDKNIKEKISDNNETDFESVRDALVFYLKEFYKINRRMIRNKRSNKKNPNYKTIGRKPPKYFGAKKSSITSDIERWLELEFQEKNKIRTIQFTLDALCSSNLVRSAFINDRVKNEIGIHPSTSLIYNKPAKIIKGEEIVINDIIPKLNNDLFEEIIDKVLENLKDKTVVYSQYTDNIKYLKKLLVKKDKINFTTHTADLNDGELVGNFLEFSNEDSFTHVLLADASIEEGKNLQFVERLICIDFPFDPLRVEQLLGRFDRWKGQTNYEPVELFIYNDEVLRYWVEILKHGYGVFEKSISSVQFNLSEANKLFSEHILEYGFMDIDELSELIDKKLKEEKRNIDLQDLIDSVEETSSNSFKKIAEFENVENEKNKFGLQKWISNLGFFFKFIQGTQDIFLLGHEYIKQPREDQYGRVSFNRLGTVVLKEFYEKYLLKDLQKKSSGSFSRLQLLNYQGPRNLRLYRYGDKFIDLIYKYTKNINLYNFSAINRISTSMSQASQEDLMFICLSTVNTFEKDKKEVNNLDVTASSLEGYFPPIYSENWYQFDPKKGLVDISKQKDFIYEFLVGDYTSKPSNKYFDKELSESLLSQYFDNKVWEKLKNNLDEEANLISKKKNYLVENNLNQLDEKISEVKNLIDIYKIRKNLISKKTIDLLKKEYDSLIEINNQSSNYDTKLIAINLVILTGKEIV